MSTLALRAATILALGVLVPASAAALPPWCQPRRGVAAAVIGDLAERAGGALLGGGRIVSQAVSTGNALGSSPNPGTVFRECIGRRLPGGDDDPPPPPPDVVFPGGVPPDGDNSWVYGDPHLVTRDGLRYTFGGAGDYTLLSRPDMELQARFTRRSLTSPASAPVALALRVADVTVVLMQDEDPELRRTRMLLDGAEVPFASGSWVTLPRGGYVHRAGDLWRIEVPGVLALAMATRRMTLELLVAEELEGTVGLLGDGDGDPANDVMAGGRALDPRDLEALHADFLEAWQRRDGASLFTTPYDAARLGPVVPPALRSLADFTPEERGRAQARCLEAGVPAAGPLPECTYDLLVTGDETFLADHLEAALGVSAALSPEVVFGAAAAPLATLRPGDMVRPGAPVRGAGTLAEQPPESAEVDVFVVADAEGARIAPEAPGADSPCSEASPVRMAFHRPDARDLETSLGCEAIPLPAGTTRLSVFAVGGAASDYAFTLVPTEPAPAPAVELRFDPVGPGEPVERSFTLAPDERIYLEAVEESPGEGRFELENPRGAVARRWTAGLDAFVEDTEAGEWTLRFLPADGSEGVARVRRHVVPPDSVVDAALGEAVRLFVTAPGQTSSARVALEAGERVYVDREASALAAGTLVFSGPDGAVLAMTTRSEEDLLGQASVRGSHRVTWIPFGANRGTMDLTLFAVADDTRVDLMRGVPQALVITTPGQRAEAVFALSGRETAEVSAAVAGDALVELRGPGGERLRISVSRTPVAIDAADTGAGTYALVLRGSNEGTGSAQVTLD